MVDVYKRLQFLNSQGLSLLLSMVFLGLFLGLWHGILPGYILAFMYEFLTIACERDVNALVSQIPGSQQMLEWLPVKFTLIALEKVLVTFYLSADAFVTYNLLKPEKFMPIFLRFGSAVIPLLLWQVIKYPLFKLAKKNKSNWTILNCRQHSIQQIQDWITNFLSTYKYLDDNRWERRRNFIFEECFEHGLVLNWFFSRWIGFLVQVVSRSKASISWLDQGPALVWRSEIFLSPRSDCQVCWVPVWRPTIVGRVSWPIAWKSCSKPFPTTAFWFWLALNWLPHSSAGLEKKTD